MRTKRLVIAGAVVLVVLLAVGSYAIYQSADGEGMELVGDDPRIIVRKDQLGSSRPAIAARGLLLYDPESRCLLIEHEDMPPQAIIWPRGTRPIKDGDRRGVRVGGLFGRIGGATAFAGDRIDANGTPHGMPSDPLPGCRTDGATMIFGHVHVVSNE